MTDMLRRQWPAGLILLVATGCARPVEDLGPTPQPDTAHGVRRAVAVAAPAPSAEDSAADRQTLEALQQLEFKSVAKGTDVQGTLQQVDLDEELHRSFLVLSSNSRGGAASSGPEYDIDVESYATHTRVEYYKEFFLGAARDRFTIWLGRLNRYEGMIRDRFRAAGIPEDLVYLAMIESGYSNTAVSRANAVGMWQFMARTAPGYGLTVDDWVDERRDPFKATDAAARYLSDAKERFGSWYLAAAAYNGGPNRVLRGLQRLSRQGDTVATDDTFFELSDRRWLRRETRDYVPKLIAATLIAKDPVSFRFDSIPYLQPLVFDEIAVPDATGLDVLARLADTTIRALVELNPQYYRGVTPPRQTSIVRLPRGSGNEVAQRYAELPHADRVNFVQHKIRRGETLSIIGNRYGVTVRQLLASNPGIDPRRLGVGQRLVIPVSAAARARPGSVPAVLRGSASRYHLVRRGESLWVIAQRYGVTVNSLRLWNGIRSGDVLRTGTRLVVAPR
ncbi:MAG: transglycosylase SLT domain-containing protein [Gemmatimonadota bacterium]|nr:MAG: transglycosylase SLT domain-containing protein [Gemmatimonadota bacterium]